jgi:hypothetical protein
MFRKYAPSQQESSSGRGVPAIHARVIRGLLVGMLTVSGMALAVS